MMAILLDRHLQSVANYLILSLALADLLVAVLVMPLGAVYEVTQLEPGASIHLYQIVLFRWKKYLNLNIFMKTQKFPISTTNI